MINMQKGVNKSRSEKYTKADIKKWVNFGIQNGYVNKHNREEIVKWIDLILTHRVVNMKSRVLLDENL